MSMLGCRPLTDEELTRVEHAFSGQWCLRNRAMFILGYTTGFRISELLSLRVKDVLAGAEIVKRVKVPRRHMKRQKASRSAILAPIARHHLQLWLDELNAGKARPASSALFASRKGAGKPISRIQAHRILKTAFERALLFGPDGTLGTHVMRKTFASKMWDYYGDIFAVQHALGHRSPASTVAYLSFNDDDQVAAVEAVWPETQEVA